MSKSVIKHILKIRYRYSADRKNTVNGPVLFPSNHQLTLIGYDCLFKTGIGFFGSPRFLRK